MGILKVPKAEIALRAQQPADLGRFVVVVYGQHPVQFNFWSFANGAAALLASIDRIMLLDGQAVFGREMLRPAPSNIALPLVFFTSASRFFSVSLLLRPPSFRMFCPIPCIIFTSLIFGNLRAVHAPLPSLAKSPKPRASIGLPR